MTNKSILMALVASAVFAVATVTAPITAATAERTVKLVRSLSSTGMDDWKTGWGSLFARGKARFGSFTHQTWVAWVRQNASESWASWIAYVEGRYGY